MACAVLGWLWSGASPGECSGACRLVANRATAVFDGSVVVSNPATFLTDFSDVPRDHWAYQDIMACALAGIVQGYPDGSYRPELPVSRDQMAVFVVRGVNAGEVAPMPAGEVSFADVPPDHWAFPYVELAHAYDIVSGYPDGLYRPDRTVDRGQMAVFIARSLVVPSGEAAIVASSLPESPTFPDVTSENAWGWCYPHVEYIVCQGVVQGYPDGLYRPEAICSREQMAVFMRRAFTLTFP